ncbi:hypothetical protein AOXY_G17674 [Acipenser oxyrinchus oxyrinchus]|uniref:Single-pass membrane and coiled-coil domain-containing protein 3 n=1 Tax=Acipenser oxyrinchus oxyrinchus TaxID=40147 RepID=A0AAD8D571_ACIOX|nr:hypothetical protein AOXY_G17674 [Acipenser oxyrinchus oxyrinchus]
MSWSDIFYPDNPKRREKVLRLKAELQECMSNNFRATNLLITAMNKHLGCSFPQIQIINTGTINENCQILIESITKIQEKLAQIDQKLKEELEPEIYQKLHDANLPSDVQKNLSKLIGPILGVMATVGSIVLITLIGKGIILTAMVTGIGAIATGLIALFSLAVVILGVDMIISAIVGAEERDQLEYAIREYEKALKTFKPASEQYQEALFDAITKVKHMDD